MTTTTTDPLSSFAALGPGDPRDAHRRRPGADLSAYAAARGLEALGSAAAAGYLAAMPGDEALQFKTVLSGLPYVGRLFDLAGPPPVAGDGRRQAVGVPCTVAAAPVPEAAAYADLSIDNRAKPAFVSGHRERLGPLDLRGWDLTATPALTPTKGT